MSIQQRVIKLEQQRGNKVNAMIWLKTGETEEAALARWQAYHPGIIPAQTMFICNGQVKPDTFLSHFLIKFPLKI